MGWGIIALRVVPHILTAITAVEQFIQGRPSLEKRNEAKAFLRTLLLAAESAAARDLLDDAAVDRTLDQALDSLVAFLGALEAAQAARATQAPP